MVTLMGKNLLAENAKYTEIPDEMFKSRADLKGPITIPEYITRIGKSAFMFCNKIESITFNEGLKVIDEKAFYGIAPFESKLDIILPASLESIGYQAFTSGSSSEGYRKFIIKSKNRITLDFGDKSYLDVPYFEDFETEYTGGLSPNTVSWYTTDSNGDVNLQYRYFKYSFLSSSLDKLVIFKGNFHPGLVSDTTNTRYDFKVYAGRFDAYASHVIVYYYSKPIKLKTIIDLDTRITYTDTADIENNKISKYRYYDMIETLELPNIIELDLTHLEDCSSLSTLKLGNKIETLKNKISNSKLVSIIYDGTMDEWNKINKIYWNTNNQIKTIICNDGTITL